MPFPPSDRVIYERNPLAEVVCQLRFPPILRIDSQLPAAFQELIREQYPLFSEKREPAHMIELPSEIAEIAASAFAQHGKTAYQFSSAERVWTVTLTRNFLALTCLAYERWESFGQHLGAALGALLREYKPAFYERVGLRYRNVIRRSLLGLEHAPWSTLLAPHIGAELACGDLSEAIEQAAHDVLFALTDGPGKLRLQHGLMIDAANNEQCYVIDADYFTEQRTSTQHALETLEFFNGQSGRLFRWCISNQLNTAMGPQRV